MWFHLSFEIALLWLLWQGYRRSDLVERLPSLVQHDWHVSHEVGADRLQLYFNWRQLLIILLVKFLNARLVAALTLLVLTRLIGTLKVAAIVRNKQLVDLEFLLRGFLFFLLLFQVVDPSKWSRVSPLQL